MNRPKIYIQWILCFLLLLLPAAAKAEAIATQDNTLTLKVLTLNIHGGVNWYGQYDLESIARYIAEVNPDLVGLQEVDRIWSSMSRFEDIPGELARRLNMFYAYSASLERNNGNFGNLILSRYPLVSIFTELMPGSLERRSFGFVQVLVGGVRVNFVTTHLGLSDSDRLEQVKSIQQFVAQTDGPLIITGDFNGTDGDVSVNAFEGRFVDAQDQSGMKDRGTFRARNGVLVPRMDYIFASPEFALRNFRIDDNYISDHLPLIAEFDLNLRNQLVAGEPVFYNSPF